MNRERDAKQGGGNDKAQETFALVLVKEVNTKSTFGTVTP